MRIRARDLSRMYTNEFDSYYYRKASTPLSLKIAGRDLEIKLEKSLTTFGCEDSL